MAEVTVSEVVALDRERAWALMSDLSRLDEWLELHEAWRSDVPSEIHAGTKLSSIVSFKGMRNRIAWTVDEFEPPDRIALSGDGKGGTKASLSLAAEDAGDGKTKIRLRSEFSNPALVGPLGRVAARGLKGELERSIKRLAQLVG
jgi:uncharacterized protein YndB with AHSA1/START domain